MHKIYRITKFIFGFSAFLLSVVLILVGSSYIATRYSVTVDASGNYAHSDPETTNILNYFCGKEELHLRFRTLFLREEARLKLKLHKHASPDSFENLDFAGLENICRTRNLYCWEHPQYVSGPETCKVLWQMEKEVGAPKIRWGTRIGTSYHPASNTVFLQTDRNGLNDLISEFSHAQQTHHHPLREAYQRFPTICRVVGRSLKKRISLTQAYDMEYDTADSIEYQAHKIIEPKLREEMMGHWPLVVHSRIE